MPGKPHRFRVYQRLVESFPEPQPLSTEEQEVLSRAMRRGLIARLERVAPNEAEAVQKSMLFWQRIFGLFVQTLGLAKAEGIATAWIAKVSLKDMKKVEKSLDAVSLQLLFEYSALVKGIPGRYKDLRGRKVWLKNQGVNTRLVEEVVLDSDADMAEEILAKRHGMSLSKVHKILAKATKMIASHFKARES